VGENIAFTQSKLAIARGASRQWNLPWSAQVSPWFSGACTTSGPLRQEAGGARGLDAGHSLSFYARMWLHGWFAGASMVTPENSVAIFFEKPAAPWTLTSHGRKAAEVFQFTQAHDRGVPWTPVAVVLDHLAGYNGYMDKPWGILEPTPGDREIRDLFDFQLFPGGDHIHGKPNPANPEGSYLRPTPYGEMFDVVLSSVTVETLAAYPVLLLAGDVEFDDGLVTALEGALRRGSKLLIAERHRDALGARLEKLRRAGDVEVLAGWRNPATGRATAISNTRLEGLAREYLPVVMDSGVVEYQINRTRRGWVVELVNNTGVAKKPGQPAVTDEAAVARVRVRPVMKCLSATEWVSGRTQSGGGEIEVNIGPGRTEFVEFATGAPGD
jgi:hypothetical protein